MSKRLSDGLPGWFFGLTRYGLENVARRFYSKYSAAVDDDADPQNQGRVKVVVDGLGRTKAHEQWAYPSSPYAGNNYGFFFPPHKGDRVWTWFHLGDKTQPAISGGWWCNPAIDKKPGTSHVPEEFKSNGGSPTARGIKTQGGSGLKFEDAPATKHVELWAGSFNEGAEATKQHRLRMDKTPGQEGVILETEGKHSSTWQDVAGQVYQEHKTPGGHRVFLSDTPTNEVIVEHATGHFLRMDLGQVRLTTAGGQLLNLSDLAPNLGTLIQTVTGQFIQQLPTGTTISDPGLMNLTAGGAMTLASQGIAIQSTSGAASSMVTGGVMDSTFAGLKTEKLQGGLTQTVTGLWNMGATIAKILSGDVEIGAAGDPKFFIVTEEFLTRFLLHTHTSALPGLGSSVVDQPLAFFQTGNSLSQHVKVS